ncbi:MAG: hypothetical protein WBG73_23205 [Coleofasciculaceae cyanobacterium]
MKPKYIRFSKFKSENLTASNDEAARLIKLKKQIKQLKRQRLIFTTGVAIATAIIVYWVKR